jgi:mRNA interferase HicA
LLLRRGRGSHIKYSEFRKWLKNQGAVLTPAKGSHFRVTLNGRTTIFPDHGSREIGKGLVEQIKKQLGLK